MIAFWPSGRKACRRLMTCLGAAGLIVFGAICLSCSSDDIQEMWFDESQWRADTVLSGSDEVVIISGFTGPYGVTLAEDNSVFVPDLKEGLVVRFTPDLEFNGWLGLTCDRAGLGGGWEASGWHHSGWVARGSGGGMFNMAHSVDFNSAGVIFIADYLNGRIHTYDPTGQFLGLFFDHPQSDDLAFAGPANAWFDPVGNLWVSDFDKHRIMKFGPDGNLIGWMGESEAGGPTLGFVTEGVAVSSPAPGGFCKPQMVRVDTEGLIYVVETGNHRIQRFGPDGTLRGWIGAAGDGTLTDGWSYAGTSIASALPGGLNEPVSLELTEDGMLLVADNGNHRLARFTLDGHFAGWIGGRAGGGTVTDWSLGGASASGSDPGQFRHPFDARVRAGRLYVADGHNGRVQILPWASATP